MHLRNIPHQPADKWPDALTRLTHTLEGTMHELRETLALLRELMELYVKMPRDQRHRLDDDRKALEFRAAALALELGDEAAPLMWAQVDWAREMRS